MLTNVKEKKNSSVEISWYVPRNIGDSNVGAMGSRRWQRPLIRRVPGLERIVIQHCPAVECEGLEKGADLLRLFCAESHPKIRVLRLDAGLK